MLISVRPLGDKIDIRMPGSTGFDLQQKLAASDNRIPVIVISAGDDAHIRERARELGAVSFFRKPVDDQALIDASHWAPGVAKQKKLNKKSLTWYEILVI